ncbi:hypothetical protein ACQZV8_20755 [Magnetococcales bacterium HHB-1]
MFTISPKSDDFDYVKEKILPLSEITVMVEEYGSNGTHPHLHGIVDKDCRTDSYTRKLKQRIEPVNALVRTKQCYDLSGALLYMRKEEEKKILINRNNYDLSYQPQNIKTKWSELISESVKEQTTIPANVFPRVYLKYCNKLMLDPHKLQVNLGIMVRDGITMMNIRSHKLLYSEICALLGEKYFLDL